MVSSSDPNYPKGFRDNQGIQPEPRTGIAWDIAGDGKTAIHASAGLYHNPHVNANGMDAMARNPPSQNTPSIFYGTMDTLLAAGAAGAFSNRPSNVFGIERAAKTPQSFNYSAGIQRELGWGTVIDVTYAGYQMKHGEMSTNVNVVPDEARFLDIHPENRNPQTASSPKANEFLRPYSGYQDITIRSHFGDAHYNSLQVQLNRRYIHGLQFGVAYTLGKTISLGPNSDPPTYIPNRPGDAWNVSPYESTQLHNLVVNYTWDVPNGSRVVGQLAHARRARRVAAFGRHRSRQRRLGRRGTSTTDNFDFTGGDAGTRPRISGDVLCSGGDNCDPTPGNPGSYFNISAFSRLTGRGDYGNAPRSFYRLPKSSTRICRSSRTLRLAAPSGSSSDGRCTTSSTR